MVSFTFVTALYEIKREQHDRRSFSQYQSWFQRTLQIPVPMVIYTEEKNRHIVESTRHNLPTKVIYTSLEEVPFYYTVNDVKNIIENSPFKSRIMHPNGLENRCYEYIPIINSKFKWISNAIENNYFDTDMFFWIDAGLSRFMNFDISLPRFSDNLISRLNSENMLYFQIGKEEDLITILNDPNKIISYIGTNTNFIMAGFFGGNRKILNDICLLASELYIKEFIEKEQIDNEQTLIGYILPKYKDKLFLIKNKPGYEYTNYYIFCNKLTFT